MGKFPSPNQAMPITCIVHQASHSQSALHLQCYILYTSSPSFIGPFLYEMITYFFLVSSDIAIAIAFGLFSTIIGLLGLLVGYLTLRAMPLGMQLANRRIVLLSNRTSTLEKDQSSSTLEIGRIHRHEHKITHFVSLSSHRRKLSHEKFC
jgi:hypothetical protein